MIKKVLFQLHWLTGITAGIVIAIVGLTGAALSFETELLESLNRGVVTVPVRTSARLPVHELLAKINAAHPGKEIMSVNVFAAPDRAARVMFAAEASPQAAPSSSQSKAPPRRRGEMRYVDPYSGELLGAKELRGQSVLKTIERIHRGMVAGPTGRAVVGASTIVLIVLALSGLYLRWPRSGALKWRTWFKIHGTLKGRAFLWNLHSVIGTWLLPIYLLASLTGLYFAYDWYRQGLIAAVGATPMSREAPKLDMPATTSPNIGRLWAVFEQSSRSYASATLSLPATPEHSVEIRYLDSEAVHERALDRIVLHPETGNVLKHERFVDKSAGNQLVGSILPLHSGAYFGIIGKIIVMFASLLMPLFAITGWMLYLKRRRSKATITKPRDSTSNAIAEFI